jgi:hypothetical protein
VFTDSTLATVGLPLAFRDDAALLHKSALSATALCPIEKGTLLFLIYKINAAPLIPFGIIKPYYCPNTMYID